jgi:hypothetical protein
MAAWDGNGTAGSATRRYGRAMRATRLVFVVLGWLMLVGGLVMMGFAALDTDHLGVLLGLGGAGLSLVITAVVFLVAARYLRNFTGADALTDGVAGTARVLSVSDTGVTINNVNAVLGVRADISVPGQAPYEGEFRIAVGRTQWGAIQPGMTLPVLVERADPTKIVHDPSRSAIAASAGTPAGVQTMTAADVIARGIATQGVLHAADPTGMTAGQVIATLPAHEADDPLMKVVFTYTPSGMGERRNEVLVRVPDGKGHWLVPGETLPIAYLPDDPTTATIDWSRL